MKFKNNLFDFLTFGILPIILAAAMIVPRYISSNKTSYILVENYIIVDQGGGRRIDIPINDIDFVTLKYGMFGRTLGYATFLLNLKVSTQQDIVDEINSIEKSLIEKEIQKLEEQETDISKEQLNIAKAKIDALDSNYYEKI